MSRSSVDDRLIERLGDTLRAQLASEVGHRRRVALVGFPLHDNVGDSAIWLGERLLLRQLGLRCVYVAATATYNPRALRAADPDMILICGGGNFGDVYEDHEALRAGVLADFPDIPTVQLPQSIHYQDPANAARIRDLAAAHRSFVVMARDSRSEHFAREVLHVRALLSPDAAFVLGPIHAPQPATHRPVHLLRTDGEALERSSLDSEQSLDWIDKDGGVSYMTWRSLDMVRRLPLLGPGARALGQYFDLLARAQLRRGVGMLNSGDSVITDRLHAHILSVLMGRRNVLLDNNYGKLTGFHDAWTSDSALTTRSSLVAA